MAAATIYEQRRRRRSEAVDGSGAGLAIVIVLIGGLMAGALISTRFGGPPAAEAPRIDVLGVLSPPRPERVQSGFQTNSRPSTDPAAEAPGSLSASTAGAAAAAGAPAVPTAVPTAVPSPTAAPGRATIANTDGVGVVLRSSPVDTAWTPRGFMDGTSITILERQGSDWLRVRGDNGQEGWIPAKYATQS
jgi:hypothetical protein